MRRKALSIATLTVLAGLTTPARADCDSFRRRVQMFRSEQQEAHREYGRVKAMKPEPKKDTALCRAVRSVMQDSEYLIASEDPEDCIQDEKQAQDFSTQIKEIGDAAASMAGFYCSDEELRKPIHSKIDDDIP